MPKLSDELLQKQIEFDPHKEQKQVLEQVLKGKQDIIIAAGRRWGKSILCAYLTLRYLLVPDKRIWIVAPTYDLTEKIFNYLKQWVVKDFPSLMGGISTRPIPQIITPDGSWVKCKSTENPKGLLGEELDLIIIDECSRIKKEEFEAYLYPCLASRKGKLVMISTPFGQNWFYERWLIAKESNYGASFQFSSQGKPGMPQERWERAKKELPSKVFQQEYEAIFLPEGGQLFRNIEENIYGILMDVEIGHFYILGVDLGRFHDFTVITVVDKSNNQVVHLERFQDIDWKIQMARIKNVADRYNKARIYIDAEGKGDPVADQLDSEGYLVERIRIKSNRVKRQLIEKLGIYMDNHSIKYPAIETLINELQAFTYKLTDAGNITYSAPEGLHDDCVSSLALAVWGLTQTKPKLTPIQQEILNIQRSRKRNKIQYR